MAISRFSVLLFFLLLSLHVPQEVVSQNIFQRMANLAAGGKPGYEGIPTTKLSNGIRMPLVGLGAGNMMPEVIPSMVSNGLQDDKLIRLIDTSHVSHTEHLVAKGIKDGADKLRESGDLKGKIPVHVVTKVWYTHLGYERTKLSVQSSLDALKEALEDENIDLVVHVLIHWPRCYNAIEWMNCEEEEDELPQEIKDAGPPPHLNRDAWKESWKALEEFYNDESSPIKSIGVSNFHLKEMKEFADFAQVMPHIMQLNVWSLLYDPLLVDFCHKQEIHIQAFHLLGGLLHKAKGAPFAYHHLLQVGNELTKEMREKGTLGDDEDLTGPQVVLGWLIQHNIAVLPRTAHLGRLAENSALSINNIPKMTEDQAEIVAYAVEALLSGKDFQKDAYVQVSFHAKSKDIFLYWHDHEYGAEVQVAHIKQGTTFEEQTHPGHFFRIYDSEEKKGYELFIVEGKYGEHHHVEL